MKKSEVIKYVLDRMCGSYELNEEIVSQIIILLEEKNVTLTEYFPHEGYCQEAWEPEDDV